jgi:hypothetical protein
VPDVVCSFRRVANGHDAPDVKGLDMLFHIYDMRGRRVGYVDAVDTNDALKHAVKQYPGAQVDRWLTKREEDMKFRMEEDAAWRM